MFSNHVENNYFASKAWLWNTGQGYVKSWTDRNVPCLDIAECIGELNGIAECIIWFPHGLDNHIYKSKFNLKPTDCEAHVQ